MNLLVEIGGVDVRVACSDVQVAYAAQKYPWTSQHETNFLHGCLFELSFVCLFVTMENLDE